VEAALAAADEECVAATEAAEREVAEWATHWAAKMDKALAYRRDVDQREACRRTVRHQDAAICAAMVAIDAAGVIGNGDRAALL
jgi:hypothetical protein